MKTEQLIAKKVKHHYSPKERQVLFRVTSLEEHFDGLLIHESDIISVLESEDEHVVEYIKIGDVNFDNAVSKEVIEIPELTELTEEELTIIAQELKDKELLKKNTIASEIEIVVTKDNLEDNPELVSEGIVVGETIKVDALGLVEKVIAPVKSAKKKAVKK